MAKVECFNCKKVTEVSAPSFRCSFCNYPLHKYVEVEEKQPEERVIKDFKENKENISIMDVLKKRHDVARDEGVPESAPELLPKVEPIPPPKVEARIEPKKGKSIQDSILDTIKSFGRSDDPVPPPVDEKVDLKPNPKPDTKPSYKPPKSLPADNFNFVSTPSPYQKLKTEEIIFKKNTNPEKSGKPVAGWLVVHTEEKAPVTYELFEGNNVIGRPDGGNHVDIPVEDERFVSRAHCSILVKKDFLHRFAYVLTDGTGQQGSKASTNGTFINGLEERLPETKKVYLKDGDIVQVGETKLAFKDTYTSFDYEDAASKVMETDYTKTVVINYKPNY